MKKNYRKKRTALVMGADYHLAWGPVKNPDQWAASVNTDAVADKRWLRQHRKARQRVRLASRREIEAFGCMPGTTVIIKRGPNGSQVRIFIEPRGNLPPGANN